MQAVIFPKRYKRGSGNLSLVGESFPYEDSLICENSKILLLNKILLLKWSIRSSQPLQDSVAGSGQGCRIYETLEFSSGDSGLNRIIACGFPLSYSRAFFLKRHGQASPARYSRRGYARRRASAHPPSDSFQAASGAGDALDDRVDGGRLLSSAGAFL